MFSQMQWIAANEPVSAFDFNGNGRIDFNDSVKVFGEIECIFFTFVLVLLADRPTPDIVAQIISSPPWSVTRAGEDRTGIRESSWCDKKNPVVEMMKNRLSPVG